MNISRRKFAQTVSLAVIGASVAASVPKLLAQSSGADGFIALPGEAYADAAMNFTSDTFAPFIGTVFHPAADKLRRSTMQLTEVTVHNRKENDRKSVSGESFSLIFELVGGSPLRSAIHRFEHGSLGNFSLFISPVGQSGKTFEAVISHLLFN